MNNIRISKNQAIGLFLLTIIISTFLVLNFLKGQNLFNGKTNYQTFYKDIAGLTATTPVYISGYKAGIIEEIKYNKENNNFAVIFSLKSEFEIPSNSIAEIYSADIMGTRYLRITYGNSKTIAKKGDTFEGRIESDMMSELTASIGPLKDQLSSLINNLNTTLISVNSLLDENAITQLHSSFENLNETLSNAENFTDSLTRLSPHLNEIVTNLEYLSGNFKDSGDDIESSLSNINNITTQLSEAKLEEAVNNLNTLLVKIQDQEGSLGKLITTDSLHNSINSTISSIDTLIKKITENPKKYIKVSVF